MSGHKISCRDNRVYTSIKPILPKKGEIIYPDKQEKPIASWPSQSLHFVCIAKISASGRAVTDKNYSGPAVICLLMNKPKVNQVIHITKVYERSVQGELIPCPKTK